MPTYLITRHRSPCVEFNTNRQLEAMTVFFTLAARLENANEKGELSFYRVDRSTRANELHTTMTRLRKHTREANHD